MKTINVKLAFNANAHQTFEDAVKHAKATSGNLSSDLNLVNGKVLTGYKFDGSKLLLILENGHDVLIKAQRNRVNWSIGEGRIKTISTWNIDPDFVFSNGEHYRLNWKPILDSLVGTQIALSPSEQYFFLLVRNRTEFVFSSLFGDDNTIYLYFSEA